MLDSNQFPTLSFRPASVSSEQQLFLAERQMMMASSTSSSTMMASSMTSSMNSLMMASSLATVETSYSNVSTRSFGSDYTRYTTGQSVLLEVFFIDQ